MHASDVACTSSCRQPGACRSYAASQKGRTCAMLLARRTDRRRMLSLSLCTPFPMDWRRSRSSVTLADLNSVPAGWPGVSSLLQAS